MHIYYDSVEDFYDGIYHLVKKGVSFDAKVSTLSINLTGGY